MEYNFLISNIKLRQLQCKCIGNLLKFKIYLIYVCLNIYIEVTFWNNRVQNLEYIFEQLRDERIRKMTNIVQLTNSAYYPCLKNIYTNVVSGSSIVDADDALSI